MPAYFLARKLLSTQLGAVGRRAVGVHSRDLLLGARHVRVALLSGLRHLRARAREHARATHRRSPAPHGSDARRAGRRANAGAGAPACGCHRRGAGGVARRAPPTPAHCPLAAVGDSGPRPGRVSGRLQSRCGRAHRGVRRPRAFLRPCRRRQVGAVEPRPVRAQPRRRSRCRLGIERRAAAPTRRVARRAVSRVDRGGSGALDARVRRDPRREPLWTRDPPRAKPVLRDAARARLLRLLALDGDAAARRRRAGSGSGRNRPRRPAARTPRAAWIRHRQSVERRLARPARPRLRLRPSGGSRW